MTTDVFQMWFRQAGNRDANAWSATGDLYDDYRRYCVANGVVGDSGIQNFCKQLRRTLIPHRRKLGRGFRGFRLREDGKLMAAWKKQRLALHRANLNMEANG